MKSHRHSTLALAGLGVVAILMGQACSTLSPADGTGDATSSAAPMEKGGAELWAQNCMRCHNLRTPSSYTDAEWAVAAQHMRVRANLTGEEHRKILAFLQSAN